MMVVNRGARSSYTGLKVPGPAQNHTAVSVMMLRSSCAEAFALKSHIVTTLKKYSA